MKVLLDELSVGVRSNQCAPGLQFLLLESLRWKKKVGEKAQLDKRSPRISPIKRTGGLNSKGGVIWRQFLGLLYAETKVSDCL